MIRSPKIISLAYLEKMVRMQEEKEKKEISMISRQIEEKLLY